MLACLGECMQKMMQLMLTALVLCAQIVLLLLALGAVPVMLLPKPLILKKRAAARAAQVESYGRVSPQDPEEDEGEAHMHIASASHHEEEFDFGEVAIHQVCPGNRL